MQPRSLFDGTTEASLYHDTNRRGYFSVLWRVPEVEAFQLGIDGEVTEVGQAAGTRQRSHLLEELPKVIQLLPRNRDTWISQAEFSRPNRRLVNLARIGLCFVDVDTYRTKYGQGTPETALEDIRRYLDDAGLPWPSLALNSGRGLQLKWLLTSAIPRAALPRWNNIQRTLVDVLEDFGADAKAKDASRVLRLVDTVNTKSGKAVEVIWTHERNGRLAHYEFEELAEVAAPFLRQPEHSPRRTETPREILRVIPGGRAGLRRFDSVQYNWLRLEDLRALREMRWPQGVPEGWRNCFVYLATLFAAHGGIAPGRLGLEVVALTQEFAPTLPYREAQAYTSTVVKKAREAALGARVEFNGKRYSPLYTYKTPTLLSLLEVTPPEEKQLRVLVSETEAARRQRERERERRRKAGAVSRDIYLAGPAESRAEARRLRLAGLSLRDIAERLGKPVRTIRNYLDEG